jgi:hypothetical protein
MTHANPRYSRSCSALEFTDPANSMALESFVALGNAINNLLQAPIVESQCRLWICKEIMPSLANHSIFVKYIGVYFWPLKGLRNLD